MQQTIWKAVLEPTNNVQEIDVPKGATLLYAHEQHGKITVWFYCDATVATEKRRVAIVGTGYPAPLASESRYIGSALLRAGEFVFHVFEMVELRP